MYKPENFDPNKKYPIIFYFYERLADGINTYFDPRPSVGIMNIPVFVSKEYLVFCPNIHFKLGDIGNSIYEYVGSAAKMMGEKPFVDAQKMGIQGHSQGGYEVNYLITHTNMFAAACSAAGVSNLISRAGIPGQVAGTCILILNSGKTGWVFLSGTILECISKNSPLFGADKVTTPLLIMHNKLDGPVPWHNGVEYFTALHWLGKKYGCWNTIMKDM